MIKSLTAIHKDIHTVLKEETIDYDYRHTRYKINYSILIGYTHDDVKLDYIVPFMRKSDRFIPIGDKACAVVLDCTDCDTGLKAASNLMHHLHNAFYSANIFAGVATASEYSNFNALTNELYHLLKFGISENMENQVIESSQLFKGY